MLPLCICLWHDFLAASVRLSFIICGGRGLESSGRRADRGSLRAQVWQLCSPSLLCRDLPHTILHFAQYPCTSATCTKSTPHRYDTSSKEPSRSSNRVCYHLLRHGVWQRNGNIRTLPVSASQQLWIREYLTRKLNTFRHRQNQGWCGTAWSWLQSL